MGPSLPQCSSDLSRFLSELAVKRDNVAAHSCAPVPLRVTNRDKDTCEKLEEVAELRANIEGLPVIMCWLCYQDVVLDQL